MSENYLQIEILDSVTPFNVGQNIQGVIHVHLADSVQLIDGISVGLERIARVGSDPPKQTDSNSKNKVEPNERHLKTFPVMFIPQAANLKALTKGHHKYEFNYPIPLTGTSSSATGQMGTLQYIFWASMKREGSSPLDASAAISIDKYLDLSAPQVAPVAFSPFSINWERLSCCKVKTLQVTMSLPQCGYVLGQVIPFQFNIVNLSNFDLTPQLFLVQMWMFKGGDGRHFEVPEILSTISCPVIEKGRTFNWTHGEGGAGEFKIPMESQVTHFGSGCAIMDVLHFLHFVVDLKMAKSMDEFIPIIVGTIPLVTPNIQLAGKESKNSVKSDKDLNNGGEMEDEKEKKGGGGKKGKSKTKLGKKLKIVGVFHQNILNEF